MAIKAHHSNHDKKANHTKKAQHAGQQHKNNASAKDKHDFKKAMNAHGNKHGNASKHSSANHSGKAGGNHAHKANGAGHGQHGGHNGKTNGAGHGQHGGHNAKTNGAGHGQHGGHSGKANGAGHGQHGGHNAKANGADHSQHADKQDGSDKSHDANDERANPSNSLQGSNVNRQAIRPRSGGGLSTRPPVSQKQLGEVETKTAEKFHQFAEDQPDGSAVKKYDRLRTAQAEVKDRSSSIYGKGGLDKINKAIDEISNDPDKRAQISNTYNQAGDAATEEVTGMKPYEAARQQKNWYESDATQKYRDNLGFDKRARFTQQNIATIAALDLKSGEQAQRFSLNHDLNMPLGKKFRLAGPEDTYQAMSYGLQNRETRGRIISGGIAATVGAASRFNRGHDALDQQPQLSRNQLALRNELMRDWDGLSQAERNNVDNALATYGVGNPHAGEGLRGKPRKLFEVASQGLDALADSAVGVLGTMAMTGKALHLDRHGGSPATYGSAVADGLVGLQGFSQAANTMINEGRDLGLIGPTTSRGTVPNDVPDLENGPGSAALWDVRHLFRGRGDPDKWDTAQKWMGRMGYLGDAANMFYGARDFYQSHQQGQAGNTARRRTKIGLGVAFATRGVTGALLHRGNIGTLGRAAGRYLAGNRGAHIGEHFSESAAQTARAIGSWAAETFFELDRSLSEKQAAWDKNSRLKTLDSGIDPDTSYLNQAGKSELEKLNQHHQGQIDQINKDSAGNFYAKTQNAPAGLALHKFGNLLHAKQIAREGNSPESNLINLDRVNTQLDDMRKNAPSWGKIEQARHDAYVQAFNDVTGIQGLSPLKDEAYGAWQQDAFGKNVSLDAGSNNTPAKVSDYNIPQDQASSWGLNNDQHSRSTPVAAQIASQDYQRYHGNDGNPLSAQQRAGAQLDQLWTLQGGKDSGPDDGYLTPDGRDALMYLMNGGPLYGSPDALPFGYDPQDPSQSVGNWYNPEQGFHSRFDWGANVSQ